MPRLEKLYKVCAISEPVWQVTPPTIIIRERGGAKALEDETLRHYSSNAPSAGMRCNSHYSLKCDDNGDRGWFGKVLRFTRTIVGKAPVPPDKADT